MSPIYDTTALNAHAYEFLFNSSYETQIKFHLKFCINHTLNFVRNISKVISYKMSNEIVYGGNTMAIRPALEGGVEFSDKYFSSELNLCTLKDDPLQLFSSNLFLHCVTAIIRSRDGITSIRNAIYLTFYKYADEWKPSVTAQINEFHTSVALCTTCSVWMPPGITYLLKYICRR